jgi:hypothetical protein
MLTLYKLSIINIESYDYKGILVLVRLFAFKINIDIMRCIGCYLEEDFNRDKAILF